MNRLPAMPEPLVIGHRGDGKGPRENSLRAVEEARAAGADAVEIDVRYAAGGEPIVMHDPTLERVTNGRDRRSAAQLSLDELRIATLEDGEPIPTLESLLERCAELGLLVNVELKRDVPDRRLLVDRAAKLLQRFGPVWISSFDPWMLAHHRSLAPSLATALLVHPKGWRRHLRALSRPLGVAALHPHHSLVTRERVRRWRARGLAVFPWTINDPAAMRYLLDAGATGLISDEPALLCEIVRDRKRRPGGCRPV